LPIPSWPKGTPFEHAPTFDMLWRRSGLKQHAIRARLKGVPHFKCSDNSVRYDEAAALEALEDAPPEDLEDPAAAAVSEPLPVDATQAALALMNRTLLLQGTIVRERGDIVRVLTAVIEKMGEPLRLGQELVRSAMTAQGERNKVLESERDTTWRLLEDLHNTQAEREQQRAEQQQTREMQQGAWQMAKEYLPSALDKFALSMEAGAAWDFLSGIEPDLLEMAMDPKVGFVSEEQRPKALKLLELMRAKQRARAAQQAAKEQQQRAESKPATHETSAATSAAPETATTQAPAETAGEVSSKEPG
jgi:hypothetical protein